MIVSDIEQFVFIHNPKTAGTTVRFALNKYDSYEGKFWRNFHKPLGGRGDMAHLSIDSISKHFPSEYEKIMNYYSFGFCRDPLPRFLSGFNETHKALYKNLNDLGDSFIDEYVGVLERYVEKFLSSDHPEGMFTHVKPQHTMFYLNGEKIVDDVVRIEDWEKESTRLESNLSVDVFRGMEAALKHSRRNNKILKYSISDLLDSRVLRRISEFYRHDYVFFGY